MNESYKGNICSDKDETMTDAKIIAKTEEDTALFAYNIAKTAQKGDCFCLHGDLGAGKTSFSRYFIQSIISKDTEVPSPTFTLVQTYDKDDYSIWHFDLYRVEDPEEIYELGWEEAIQDNILLIEWPEKAQAHMPKTAHHIYITINDDQTRTILIKQSDYND